MVGAGYDPPVFCSGGCNWAVAMLGWVYGVGWGNPVWGEALCAGLCLLPNLGFSNFSQFPRIQSLDRLAVCEATSL